MKIRTVLTAVVAVAVLFVVANEVQAQGTLDNHLFQQYTTQGANQTDAGMYPAPHWVPPYVGHSYRTYQPLMPHEMMYEHSRNYYNWSHQGAFYAPQYGWFRGGGNSCGGYGSHLNKTTVRWQAGCNHMAPLPGNLTPFAGAHYNWAKYWYCVRSGGIGCNRFLGGGCAGGGCLRGKLGCSSGNCGGESLYDGGCAGGCTAKLSDETIDR